MKKIIAVPVDNADVLDGHFGHCKFFSVFNVDNNKIISARNLTPPPHEPGVLPKWLSEKGITDVIAGGMGNRAIQIFNQNNVNVFVGAPKVKAHDLIVGFLDDSIQFDANYCDH